MQIPLVDLRAQYETIKGEINAAIARVLESGNFIMGEEVERLEEEIAAYCGTKYAIGVASGTDALLLSLIACDIKEGDEVITTPFTFIATTEVVSKVRARILFVDIDPKTYNLDVHQIEQRITARTKAILPVHLYGQSADMDSIMGLAKRYDLKVVEDCAQAMGAEYKGRKVGSIGDLGCISFFPSKNLGAYGDGGMVITNDAEIAERVRMLRVHGCKMKYYHLIDGFNSRLDTIQAAVLRVKLKYLDRWNDLRRKNAYYYNNLFNSNNNCQVPVIIPFESGYNKHVYYLYTVRVQERDMLRGYLTLRGISTAVYYPLPLHLQKVYADLGYKRRNFPISEQASEQVMSLPLYPELTEEQQDYVVEKINHFLNAELVLI